MKIVRIVLAVVLTMAMLVVARKLSRGEPDHLTATHGAFRFTIATVPKMLEHQTGPITLTVDGPVDGATPVWFRTSQPGAVDRDHPDRYASVAMSRSPAVPGEYVTEVTAGDKGGRFYYYFEIRDPAGQVLATFKRPDGSPFLLRYIGAVPHPVIASHVLFLFATFFCVAMAAFYGLGLIAGSRDVRPMAVWLAWAVGFCFLGGWPAGIAMNWYAFGASWEGVPFGTDATDNKTQLMLFYLLFAALSSLGTLTRGRLGRDLFAPRTLGWVGLGALAVQVFIFLIPHSIQFSPAFTYAFCYSWIGAVALLYIIGLVRSRRLPA